MSQPLHHDLVRCLTDDTPPRVWSLLVTVFGDLAQAPGARISGRALGVLLEAIGVKPAALRVALHRLRKDGWIESHRSGRQSFHQLTRQGLHQTLTATPRIYGACDPQGPVWLSLFERNGTTNGTAGVWVAPNTLISKDNPERSDALSVLMTPEMALPDWMAQKICAPDTLAHAQTFTRRLDRCAALLSKSPGTAAVDTAVLRVLVVHGWRRIVLKVPDLPDHVFPMGWPGARCRQQVQQLLTDHPRVDLSDLHDQAARESET